MHTLRAMSPNYKLPSPLPVDDALRALLVSNGALRMMISPIPNEDLLLDELGPEHATLVEHLRGGRRSLRAEISPALVERIRAWVTEKEATAQTTRLDPLRKIVATVRVERLVGGYGIVLRRDGDDPVPFVVDKCVGVHGRREASARAEQLRQKLLVLFAPKSRETTDEDRAIVLAEARAIDTAA